MASGRPIYEPNADAQLAGHRYAIERLKRRRVPNTRILHVIVDGAGSVIATGIAGDAFVDFNCEILKATLLADDTGSVEVDIWKVDIASFPPDSSNSIVALDPPTLSGAITSQDTTLTDWTTTIAAGDCLRFNINSVDSITRLVIALTLQPYD